MPNTFLNEMSLMESGRASMEHGSVNLTLRASNPRQRILVVEDNDDIRQLNAEVLICSGYQVDAVDSAFAAWEALQVNSYDLLLTDNNMPKMTGLDLLKKMHLAGIGLPVVMATGNWIGPEYAKYPWFRTSTILLKPYTFDELLGTVKKILYKFAVIRGEVAPPPNWPARSELAGSQSHNRRR